VVSYDMNNNSNKVNWIELMVVDCRQKREWSAYMSTIMKVGCIKRKVIPLLAEAEWLLASAKKFSANDFFSLTVCVISAGNIFVDIRKGTVVFVWMSFCDCFFCISSRALRHCSHAGLLYPYPNEFRHSTPEALNTKRRERPLLAKDGTKTKE
jgi:hypothetical protein